MSYAELAAAARGNIGPFCKACPVCDGRACAGVMPGPGDKGVGHVAEKNWRAWQSVSVNMDTLHEFFSADTRTTVLGRELSLPVMIGPVGDVQRHYGEKYDTVSYNRCVLTAAAGEGTLAWTGDGLDGSIMTKACGLIDELGGAGVPTVKPWDEVTLGHKLEEALAARPAAVAMDIDAAGLPFLRGQQPPAGAKSAAQIADVATRCHEGGVPFVLKGVMTPAAALRAAEAGVDAIVVSNHGGRVLDGTPATAAALPAIVDAVGERVEVLVDGGIRSGLDVFRALALGARACLVCRPFVVAAFGGGEDGVRAYLAQLRAELADAMEMCGSATVVDVTRDLLWG
ncbi:alpha-hydroxy-acid oxidizing protein [Thermophilibacter provencensis]|uniref:Alpha-hydroxy-acid oxidizing protein n=1 Tax=Thermophilibacter provencensis TaxID=1852386 RepID=A0ABT7V2Z2_9ACTN|nr:alpha-hydroxy-acid oxidizing protein [Thermophilibacter provencensis]MDM8270964.1 alpha-hydroxy-acid oxidizing protein [Thermophilibacter provencensis]